MGVSVGDVVTLTVTEVAGYACWGFVGDQTGFVHCCEWSWDTPIPDADTPKVGDHLRVKVFHLTDKPQERLPADVTFDGRIRVDFAGSVKLLRPRPEAAEAQSGAPVVPARRSGLRAIIAWFGGPNR